MKICDLKPAVGSKHKKKILGRGRGSGHGGSSTRGTKGQKSRSGGAKPPWFEGGQTPLLRRIPKRGFSNLPFKRVFEIVNLDVLEKMFSEDTEVTLETLKQRNIIKGRLPVKVLGNGNLTKKIIVWAHAFSKSAIEKIKRAGGEAKLLKKIPTNKTRI